MTVTYWMRTLLQLISAALAHAIGVTWNLTMFISHVGLLKMFKNNAALMNETQTRWPHIKLLLPGFFTFNFHSRIFEGTKIPETPRLARDQSLVVATLRAFQKWIRKNFLVSFNCNHANPNWWYRRNASYARDKTNWRNKSNSGN